MSLRRAADGRPFSVYVAGPMAGLPDHGFPAFHEKTAQLRAAGYVVLNPAEGVSEQALLDAERLGPAWRETDTYRNFLKRDLRMVMECEALSLLAGWEGSRGAQLEVFVARMVGIEVWAPDATGQQTTWVPGEPRGREAMLARLEECEVLLQQLDADEDDLARASLAGAIETLRWALGLD